MQIAPYQETDTCWSCGGKLKDAFSFDQMPLTGRFPAVEDPHLSGDVSIASCDSCGLLQLKQAYSPDLMYEEYFYQSSINNTMRKHLYELVSRILNVYGGHDPRSWLDIGCNDGFLLSLAKLLGWKSVGVDPSDVIGEFFSHTIKADDCHFINNIFPNSDLGVYPDGSFDIITCISMFYDVSNLPEFISQIKRLLSKEGVWVVEMNYTLDMARNNGYDMISHEHITYFTVRSFMKMLDIHSGGEINLVDVAYSQINGGSITLFCSKSLPINHSNINLLARTRTG